MQTRNSPSPTRTSALSTLLRLNHSENGPCYNRSKSGMDDLEWWHDCEVKGLEQVKAKAIDPKTGKPGLTLAFRSDPETLSRATRTFRHARQRSPRA